MICNEYNEYKECEYGTRIGGVGVTKGSHLAMGWHASRQVGER
jgi:hypothetical protein